MNIHEFLPSSDFILSDRLLKFKLGKSLVSLLSKGPLNVFLFPSFPTVFKCICSNSSTDLMNVKNDQYSVTLSLV